MKAKFILLTIALTSLSACTSDQRDDEMIQAETKKEIKNSILERPNHQNNNVLKNKSKDSILINGLKEDLKSETEISEIITPGDVKPPKGK